MKNPKVSLVLQPVRADDLHRSWRLVVDGMDAGTLDATRTGSEAVMTLEVAAEYADRGVAQGAIGRLLGAAPWGSEVTYVVSPAASDTVLDAARAAAFRQDDDGVWRRAAPRPRVAADDITRFLDASGRIDRYPLRSAQRRELLTWVAARAFSPADRLTEPQVNDRLAPFAPAGDVAALRRYLVDHGLLERTASGSEYALVVD